MPLKISVMVPGAGEVLEPPHPAASNAAHNKSRLMAKMMLGGQILQPGTLVSFCVSSRFSFSGRAGPYRSVHRVRHVTLRHQPESVH